MDFKGFYEHTKCSAKKMYMVDAGLNFNIPFPVLLRPQRGVELYLSFDFTDRGGDDSPPFEVANNIILISSKRFKKN